MNNWTDREKAFLQDNCQSMTASQITAAMNKECDHGRSINAVRLMCTRMEIECKPADRKPWTPEEIKFLEDNPKMSVADKCRALGRSRHSIRTKVAKVQQPAYKRVTPWMNTLLEWIGDTRKGIYEMSCELWDQGVRVEIRQNKEGKMALFAIERNT